MTEDQYREWVRQAVSGEIWRKFAFALSIVGITTIYGVWSYTSNAIEDRIKAQTSALAEKMNTRIGDEITYQVKHNRLIDTAADQTAKQLAKTAIVQTELRTLIVTQSQSILRDSESSLRDLALVQVLLFGDPEQQAAAVNLALQNHPRATTVVLFSLRSSTIFRPRTSAIRSTFCKMSYGERWKPMRSLPRRAGPHSEPSWGTEDIFALPRNGSARAAASLERPTIPNCGRS